MFQGDFFTSNALGHPVQYRTFFSDQVYVIMLAKTSQDGLLYCRDQPTQGFLDTPWNEVHHTVEQVKQVLKDLDTATALWKSGVGTK